MIDALHSSKVAPVMVFNGKILHEGNIRTALSTATLVKSAAELSFVLLVVGLTLRQFGDIERDGIAIFIPQKIPVKLSSEAILGEGGMIDDEI